MLKGRLGLDTARVPHADRLGLLWLERGKIYVDSGTLHYATKGWSDLPSGDYSIPFQGTSMILLGPGTTVSHDAMRLLARHGTGLLAVGTDGTRLYASMPFGPDDSRLARAQIRKWADPGSRVQVIRRMYAMRLGEYLPQRDLNALRGVEGARVKESYTITARRYGITWHGRKYDRSAPDAADAPNQALNHASSALQAAAMIATASVGALPQIGFIHEASGISFCLDVADLFREEIAVDTAFAAVQAHLGNPSEPLERTVRRLMGKRFRSANVIPRMIDRIKKLLSEDDSYRDM